MATDTLTQTQAEARADRDFAAWDVASYGWMRNHYGHAAADAYATRLDELKRKMRNPADLNWFRERA